MCIATARHIHSTHFACAFSFIENQVCVCECACLPPWLFIKTENKESKTWAKRWRKNVKNVEITKSWNYFCSPAEQQCSLKSVAGAKEIAKCDWNTRAFTPTAHLLLFVSCAFGYDSFQRVFNFYFVSFVTSVVLHSSTLFSFQIICTIFQLHHSGSPFSFSTWRHCRRLSW